MMTPTKHRRLFVETHLVRIVALFLIVSALPATHRLVAADLRGQVIATSITTAQVKLEGSLRPKAGDAVTIYFKMDGLDDEVFVANGKVTRVEGNIASVALEPTEGKVAIGQMARIISADPTTEPSPATSVAAAPPLVSPPSSTAPPRRGKLILEDTGDNPKDLLQIAGNKNVNGEREMIANPGSTRTRPYNNLPRDFYVEGVVRSITSDLKCIVGFFFRTLEERDTSVTYESIVFVQGGIAYESVQNRQRRVPDDLRTLPPGVYADATRSVRIGVEVIGSEYRVFIDENCVTSFTGADPSKGRGLSLVLMNAGQTPCTSHYDNVRVYAASTPATMSGEKKAKTGGEKKAKFDTRKR
ncbi:MAG: hypothetical protein QOF24_2693 [Verrucomicrobiota bacterium]|jgi:hypothetical protein